MLDILIVSFLGILFIIMIYIGRVFAYPFIAPLLPFIKITHNEITYYEKKLEYKQYLIEIHNTNDIVKTSTELLKSMGEEVINNDPYINLTMAKVMPAIVLTLEGKKLLKNYVRVKYPYKYLSHYLRHLFIVFLKKTMPKTQKQPL